jgi:hypothetical protein
VLLSQILKRQEEYIRSLKEPKPAPMRVEPSLTDSGVFPLPVEINSALTKPALSAVFSFSDFHKRYVLTKEERAGVSKTVGVPAPLALHERMTKYIEAHKDDPGAPKTLKDLVLMCINHTLDTVDKS